MITQQTEISKLIADADYKKIKLLNIDIDKIYLNMIYQTGHCFCSDLVINYVNAKKALKFNSGDYVLAASLGVGATFAVMIIAC